MLKLTMNPRKRSKRFRSILRLRLPADSDSMDIDDGGEAEKEKIMLRDNLSAMLKQERSGNYVCRDYLNPRCTSESTKTYQFRSMKTKYANPSHPANARIDEYCREQIVEWSFRVVDYFRIDREVVALSLSFLDRFLASCRCDRTSFKLAATTTLHLAVKLLYPCKLSDLGILSDLSRGEFDMRDVTDMEGQILQTLKWNLHPPTAMAFSTLFLDYVCTSTAINISKTDLDDIYDVTSFFCELALCDYCFVPMPDSAIMMSAILNALEGMFGPTNRIGPALLHVAIDLDFSPQDLSVPRNRLWELYERSEECALHNDKSRDDDMWQGGNIFVKKTSATTSSPVSVSKPCHSATDFAHGPSPSVVRNNESW